MPLLSRRRFGSLAAAGAAGLILPAPFIRPARGQAREGGTLTVALYKDLRTLNPIKGIFGNEWRVGINLYDNLTRLTADGSVEGDLAESFEPSEGAKVFTFKLRRNVKFHDGSPFSAADVVATFEKMFDPKTAAPYKAEMGPIAAVKALDDFTVRFELSSPYADLPKAITNATARIISQKGIAEFDKLDTTVFGTGPFILKEFAPNDRVVMERNPNYFRQGKPLIERLVFRVLPDTSTQLAALRNREVDVIADAEPDLFKEIAAVRGVKAHNVPGGTFNNIVLYANKPPFDNPKVRSAMRLAMDRKAMTDAITAGTGSPADDHPISASYEFFDKQTPIRKQDLAEARRLLKEAGHANGFQHKLVVSNSPATREKTAVVVQAMAQQVGIDLQIEMMDNARYGSTIWNKGIESYVGNYSTRPDEEVILSKLYSAKYGIDEGRWAAPATEQMIDAIRAETDTAKRRELLVAYQRLARDEGPFIIPCFFNSLAGSWSYVNEWPIRPMSTEIKLTDVWLGSDAPGRKKG
jgi:peptide/nickel transport system substrate-binding protein